MLMRDPRGSVYESYSEHLRECASIYYELIAEHTKYFQSVRICLLRDFALTGVNELSVTEEKARRRLSSKRRERLESSRSVLMSVNLQVQERGGCHPLAGTILGQLRCQVWTRPEPDTLPHQRITVRLSGRYSRDENQIYTVEYFASIF
jgi:hypothetical protein